MGPFNHSRNNAALMIVLLLLAGLPFKSVARLSSLAEERQTVTGCPSVGFCSLRRPATPGGTCTETPWQLHRSLEGSKRFSLCSPVDLHEPLELDALCQSGCEFHFREAGWENARLVESNKLGTVNVAQIPSEDGDPGHPARLELLHLQKFEHDTYISCCRTSGGGGEDCTAELCFYVVGAEDHGGKHPKKPEKTAAVFPETTNSNDESTGQNDGNAGGRVNLVQWDNAGFIVAGIIIAVNVFFWVRLPRAAQLFRMITTTVNVENPKTHC
ncbi:hypothetical protein BV898_15602 [Hypsibius exemplaris]|uniref:Transmembrane protein n=1 Tax=Hypsibius exemplaris TaxID=2072580 RepID=A0A9X6NDC7_HYPEX|nr:hypothetical protein BV898_15602 [Hypsibius exemplaris]